MCTSWHVQLLCTSRDKGKDRRHGPVALGRLGCCHHHTSSTAPSDSPPQEPAGGSPFGCDEGGGRRITSLTKELPPPPQPPPSYPFLLLWRFVGNSRTLGLVVPRSGVGRLGFGVALVVYDLPWWIHGGASGSRMPSPAAAWLVAVRVTAATARGGGLLWGGSTTSATARGGGPLRGSGAHGAYLSWAKLGRRAS